MHLGGNTVVLPLRITLDQHASHPVDVTVVLILIIINLTAYQTAIARLGQDTPG